MSNIFESTMQTVLSEKLADPLMIGRASLFLDINPSIKRYVIGRNEQSIELIEKLNIDGLIDDFSTDSFWQGIPVVKTEKVPTKALVANCSTSISPVRIKKHLDKSGITSIGINEIVYFSDGLIEKPKFQLEQIQDYKAHAAEYQNLFMLLEDNVSKKTLMDVLSYRLTANLKYMKTYDVRLQDQYFEDFLKLNKEFFVDAGGYDGDTTEGFCDRYPNYQKVFFFEPSTMNMEAAKKRLRPYSNIEYRLEGLSNKADVLPFDAGAGSASAVRNIGSTTINVVPLDEIAQHQRVTFIKMDLEGWEMNALAGAARTIRANKPKIAIAVYHKAQDFREIPQFISSINEDYRLFLRHYTQGWSETIMYFV